MVIQKSWGSAKDNARWTDPVQPSHANGDAKRFFIYQLEKEWTGLAFKSTCIQCPRVR